MRPSDLPRIAHALAEHVGSLAIGRYRRFVGTAALIRDDAGRILIVRPGYRRGWSLPGGHASRRESLEASAAREAREETGLTVHVRRLLCVDVREPGVIVFVFAADVVGGRIDPAPLEIRAVRWLPAQDLRELRELDRSRAEEALAAEREGRVGYLAAPTIGT